MSIRLRRASNRRSQNDRLQSDWEIKRPLLSFDDVRTARFGGLVKDCVGKRLQRLKHMWQLRDIERAEGVTPVNMNPADSVLASVGEHDIDLPTID